MALVLRRQRIRETTVAILKAAGTLAADRVYPTPILPWRRERPLPAIGVYTLRERSAPLGNGNSGPFQLRQSLDLVIEMLVELATDPAQMPEERLRLDTAVPLDALCAQVSLSLLPNPLWYAPAASGFEGLEGWATNMELGRVDDTDRRTASAVLTATLNYTCIAEPTIEDEFLTAYFDVDVIDPAADPNIRYPGPDGRIEVRFITPRPTDPPLWPDATPREG